MISDKQLAANRANALRSTGPRTPEGKHRSRANAFRHGLTGQITVMPPEDREAHDKFCNEIIETLQPEQAVEQQFAQSVAEDSWRINHARALETRIFAIPDSDPTETLKQLQLLTLYEQRLNRMVKQNLTQLKSLQTERRQQREREMEQAQLLAQVSLAKGIAYQPSLDGFDFPNSEINGRIDRDNRLKEARQL